MNIFKILASGDGSINEPNISSFYAYLLDPNEGHGLGSRVLQDFLEPILIENEEYFKIKKENKLNKKEDYRNLHYQIKIHTEFPVLFESKPKNYKEKHIDIVIEISIDNGDEPEYVFCIENKINEFAIPKNQLKNEYEGIVKYYEENKQIKTSIPKLAIIFVTRRYNGKINKYFEDEIESFKNLIPCLHMIWKCDESQNNNKSIFNQLSLILEKEMKGKIEPIHDYTKQTIKSFMSFIKSDFRSYNEEKDLNSLYQKSVYEKNAYKEIKKKFGAILNLAIDISEKISKDFDIQIKYTDTYISIVPNIKTKSRFRVFTGITLQMKRISLSIRKDPSKEWYEYETELYEKYNGIIIRRNTQFKEYYNLFLNNIEDYEKYALPLLKESWKFILNTES